MHPQLASDPNYVRRFENEARAAAALVHPNIVQIFEVGRQGELHFIAQEYVAGRTLKQRLEQQGSLAAGSAVTLLRQVTAALHKADQLGIVHRDIKPENVLIDEDGVAKVADFGLAKQASQGELGLTSTGMTMGTPYYMSPEQVQGQPLDGRSDIYSLGVTAYQLLSGRLPFEGETPMSVALKHVNAPVPDLAAEAPDTPPQLTAAITKMLAKPPEARFQSPAELAATLRGIAAALGTSDALSAATTVALAEAESAASPSLLDATRKLSAAMQPAAQARIPVRSWWRWAGALLLGALLARMLIPTDPLAGSSAQPVVPQKDSPGAQYLYASLLDTKEAWQAVLEYYPADGPAERQRYYALRATAQLGRWYLENGDPASAKLMFSQLSQLDSTEREFRALGTAGWRCAAKRRATWPPPLTT